jgi:hypothetical protein
MLRSVLHSLAACLILASAAQADSAPAQSPERVQAAFQDFARQWMSKVRGLEQRRPRVSAGPGNLLFTYRSLADEFRTELQPTGQAATPYVGLLHYTEQVYSCRSLESQECTVAATVPVTEIFRLQGGRWSY